MTCRSAQPFVSVIVLNYNGLVFLDRCFSSLEQLSYPRDAFEVILVDNASSDRSVPFVQQRFPWVHIIRNRVNLGFAGGNNAGIRESRGDYIALLNNDTRVERDWLTELVKVCEEDSGVGACTPKILLIDSRLQLRMRTDPFTPADLGVSDDPRELGVIVEEAAVRGRAGRRPVQLSDGFYEDDLIGERRCRWSKGEAILTIPVEADDSPVILELTLSNPRPAGLPLPPVSVYLKDKKLADLKAGFGPRVYDIPLDWDVLQHATSIIQNAGSIVFRDGSGRDRGAIVRDAQQAFEEDRGQYDRAEEVFAACGAGALYRRAMLDDVGLLDEYFFMYYEDTDLAWRARLKGWKIMYAPRAVMRHVHCGTSIEWSPSFMFHAYRNRLAMLLKNAPLRLVFREWTRYAAAAAVLGLKVTALRASSSDVSRSLLDLRLRGRALRSLLWAMPSLMRKRRDIQRTRRAPHAHITRWMQRLD